MTTVADEPRHTKEFLGVDTKLIHAGERDPLIEGAVSMPIFQSANYEYAGEASYDDLKYIRLNNTPNHHVLHQKLAALENAEAALVTGSGMAAISTSLLSVLAAGDHVLAQHCMYGGTHSFITADLPRFGIEFDLIDPDDPDDWERKCRPNTKAIYVETIANPLLDVPDFDAIVQFARRRGLVSLIDNTVASPFNFRPPEWGFDLSLHSCTKYLNGHSDIVAGAVIGRADLVRRITHQLNHLGGSLDPHACFLLHRGMKTLAVRMRHHNAAAQTIAEFLATHARVLEVRYPGLPNHPSHQNAHRYLNGCSGLVSFRIRGGVAAADRFIDGLRLPIHAASLGGVESLVSRPAMLSHSGLTREERAAAGIEEDLVRMSVGLETPDDLIRDLKQALDIVAP